MRRSKKESGHLPVFGVGPLYVYGIVLLTVAAMLCCELPRFIGGLLPGVWAKGLDVLGVLLMASGAILWILAVPVSKVHVSIKQNKLLTTGVYAWVRHPIYSAVMLFCTGWIFVIGNLYFFILPVLYWLFLTVLMKATEEKWLRDHYGEEYEAYCQRVNRCIPSFPKRERA